MRHERIITQKGYLNFLKRFHQLSVKSGPTRTDELIIELIDKEVIEKIEVPKMIEELAIEHKMSIQDMINSVLKCFVLDWKHGRSNVLKLIEQINQNKL